MINRDLIRQIRKEIEDALVQVGKENGITIKAGNCTFAPEYATMKLEIRAIDTKTGKGISKEAVEYERYCLHFGLAKESLGMEFQYGNDTFKIIGLLKRSHKYPVLCKDIHDGKETKFPVSLVKQLLSKQFQMGQ